MNVIYHDILHIFKNYIKNNIFSFKDRFYLKDIIKYYINDIHNILTIYYYFEYFFNLNNLCIFQSDTELYYENKLKNLVINLYNTFLNNRYIK